VGNQIKERKAHDQKDDEPLDPCHIGLVILPVFTADYSHTMPRVQAEASMLSSRSREQGESLGGSPLDSLYTVSRRLPHQRI
jgi:hypothetical protein